VVLKAAVAVAAVWGLALSGTAAPQLTLNEDAVEFGEVVEGIFVERTFTITNTGDSVLELAPDPPGVIEGEEGLCPCITATLTETTLEPGESTELYVTFESWGYAGRELTLLVRLESNDPQQEVTPVRLEGTVLPREYDHIGAAQELFMAFRILVDLREREAFAQGHLVGAMNVPYAELAEVLDDLPTDAAYYLYDKDGAQAAEAAGMMRDAGFRASAAIAGGLVGWWEEYNDLLFFRAEEGAPEPPQGDPHSGRYAIAPSRVIRSYVVVVDIRCEESFASGHIPGAVNLTPDEVMDWAQDLPTPEQMPERGRLSVWVIDDGEGEACKLAEELREAGQETAMCLVGGLAEWKARFGEGFLWDTERE